MMKKIRLILVALLLISGCGVKANELRPIFSSDVFAASPGSGGLIELGSSLQKKNFTIRVRERTEGHETLVHVLAEKNTLISQINDAGESLPVNYSHLGYRSISIDPDLLALFVVSTVEGAATYPNVSFSMEQFTLNGSTSLDKAIDSVEMKREVVLHYVSATRKDKKSQGLTIMSNTLYYDQYESHSDYELYLTIEFYD